MSPILWLKFEASKGARRNEVEVDILRLANLLDVGIEVNFNGETLTETPDEKTKHQHRIGFDFSKATSK